MKKIKLNFWLIWFAVTAVSMIALFSGVRFLLKHPVTPQNIVAYFILSSLFGVISASLYLIKRKTACMLFILGLAVGFFEMWRIFLNGMGGWGDLVGIISLFTWAAIGLGCGATFELCHYVYRKLKEH